MNLKKIHYFSGLTIALFVGFHLFNHFISIIGIEKHLEVMDALRKVYRNPLVEAILLICVFTQIGSGIKLYLRKRNQRLVFFEKLQIQSGLYLAFFLTIHVGAVLMGRFILKLDTNFYFGAAGINIFPFYLFFIPYYGLAIFAFFGHIAAIHHQKMKNTILGLTPENQSKLILVIGILITLAIFYGLTNHFNGVSIPEEFNLMNWEIK